MTAESPQARTWRQRQFTQGARAQPKRRRVACRTATAEPGLQPSLQELDALLVCPQHTPSSVLQDSHFVLSAYGPISLHFLCISAIQLA